MARIYKKGKTSLVSSILNILGLTAAFAALYIILVQVHHDFTYNKALKDSDRIYVLTMPDRFSNNVYSTYVNRQMSEAVIAAVPSVEAGGCAANLGSNEVSVRLGEGQSSVELRVTSFSKTCLDLNLLPAIWTIGLATRMWLCPSQRPNAWACRWATISNVALGIGQMSR